jgi:hypothetical protein
MIAVLHVIEIALVYSGLESKGQEMFGAKPIEEVSSEHIIKVEDDALAIGRWWRSLF